MFDVFYIGEKPHLFPHEQLVSSIEQAQQLSRTRYFWIVNCSVDYTGFDFLWEPTPWESNQRHAWPSQWQKDSGTYLIPKNWNSTDTNYHKDLILNRKVSDEHWDDVKSYSSFDFTWHPDPTDPPFIYQFGTQWQKTGGPKYIVLGATKVKYIERPRYNKTSTDTNWGISNSNLIEGFDFTWHPDHNDPPFIYQFGTQWQKTGGPRYIIPGATEIKYVDQLRVKIKPNAEVAFFIDHMNVESNNVLNQIKNKIKVIKSVRYFDNYLDILKRIARNAKDYEYIWVCSSVCDYSNFDFSWHPEIWQGTMLHVFPSSEQKFGDTFYMHVPSFLARMDKIELLEWYDCNFNSDQIVPRLAPPQINHHYDSHALAIKEKTFHGPVAVFANTSKTPQIPAISLWRPKTRAIIPLTSRGSIVVVPRDAVSEIKTQLYDYPYINKSNRKTSDDPLDIVFISNGESIAEKNWSRLKEVTKSLPNRVVRVDGINGRIAAYHAALQASNTPWAFCVFAKLNVNEKFDWNWQPDCLQQAKHYIFHAFNPINKLTYGHMAMIAYNKNLVLENYGTGLDFTLDQPHEVVPMLSGTALYADDPWTAWRTAFREVIKLLHAPSDIERDYRLKLWKTAGNGTLAEWSKQGALDAEEFFFKVNGNFDELKKSYEWDWLRNYFIARCRPTQDITRSAI